MPESLSLREFCKQRDEVLLNLLQQADNRSWIKKTLASRNDPFGKEFWAWYQETRFGLEAYAKEYEQKLKADPSLRGSDEFVGFDDEDFVNKVIKDIFMATIRQFVKEGDPNTNYDHELLHSPVYKRCESLLDQLARQSNKYDVRLFDEVRRAQFTDHKKGR
jgi:hypothetical protein